MKKAILISINPARVEKILNGEKTIEIRKSMPKCDLPIDVYIYVTKGGANLYKVIRENYIYFSGAIAEPFDTQIGFNLTKEKLDRKYRDNIDNGFSDVFTKSLNGKVVAKFTLNEVETIKLEYIDHPELGYGINENCGDDWYEWESEDLLEKCCLTYDELYDYGKHEDIYAWHIENLQIFDKPMELNQFEKYYDEPDDLKPCCNGKHCIHESYDWCENQSCCEIDYDGTDCPFLKVNKAPQSWKYIYIGD